MAFLSKLQRNDVFNAIAQSRLDISGCVLKNESNYASIEHLQSASVFVLERIMSTRYRSGSYKGFADVGDEPRRIEEYPGFEDALAEISKWASAVASWTEVPDLWKEIPSMNIIPGEAAPDSANTPFTAEEQKAISGRLKAIAETVKQTYQLTDEQSAKLDEKFEESEKASRRMGRKDWGLLFGGAVFSLILSDAITPGVAGHILIMVEHGVGNLFIDGPSPIHGILGAGRE